jgi:SAM-dependent methyltransferase
MSVTLLTGLPGSGKSKRLIEHVNASLDEGRSVRTFVCSDFPWPSHHEAFWIHRRLVCGEPGLTCSIDHFVSREEASSILAAVPAGSLAAIEEGYAFGNAAVEDWTSASDRGVEVVVAAPSDHQQRLLKGEEHAAINFGISCQRCGIRHAFEAIVNADGRTTSLCDPCFQELARDAQAEILECLRDEHPFPGEEALYQPVELAPLADWRLARWDTMARANAMADVLEGLGIVPNANESPSYLDVGCNTGSFCDYFARRGFRVKGVDATERFITVARLLDAFFRRHTRPTEEWALYEQANAYEYLRDTTQERFDVTSAFATFQWVMIQRTPEHGLECIEWLAEKTKRVCFLEMGYTREEMYKDQLRAEIDREWVLAAMQERGGFSDIRVIDAAPDSLQRDLFAGVKSPSGGS